MSKILVTGGAGFIGSHFVKALIDRKFEVIIIDNFSRDNKCTIQNSCPFVEFVEANICDEKIIEDYVKKADIVFHLAAMSRVMPSISDPRLCFQSNIHGTEIIARLCTKFKKKLIFSSSREVYGSVKDLPINESHFLNPENPYGASKIAGESIIQAYSTSYGLNFIILRLANVYGANDFDRVIPTFINKSMKNQDIIIYGGEQVIDFVYIDDIINAFFLSLDSNINRQTFNIGSGRGIKLQVLAEIIINLLSSRSRIVFNEKRRGEVDRFVADISNAKYSLKWDPKISLDIGLKMLIDQ
jgi:UDP-glucose 4-epimerase